MAINLPADVMLDFIIGDFADPWEAVALIPGNLHRGNFMFARQAMTLLEVACRMCASDPNGAALDDLSKELHNRDPRYFILLPGICLQSNRKEFLLPRRSQNPERELIAALFDLIRNGQAHQYQQINVDLKDGKHFCISLTGVEQSLKSAFARGRPADHLALSTTCNGDLLLNIRTDVLFLDIRDSIEASKMLDCGLYIQHLTRGRNSQNANYSFSCADLERALAKLR